MRLFLLTAAAALAVRAAEPPKLRPQDYCAHAALPTLTLAADYLARTLPGRSASFHSPDYLVVDIAVFPRSKQTVKLAASHFSVKLNGKKQPVYAQTPGMVAASMKYPDWRQRPRFEGQAGGVIIGQPQPRERFPGDPRGIPGPRPPRAPEEEDRSGVEKAPRQQPEEAVIEEALVEGAVDQPVRGYLYFPYHGKLKNIRTVELIYSPDGAAPTTLKLQ